MVVIGNMDKNFIPPWEDTDLSGQGLRWNTAERLSTQSRLNPDGHEIAQSIAAALKVDSTKAAISDPTVTVADHANFSNKESSHIALAPSKEQSLPLAAEPFCRNEFEQQEAPEPFVRSNDEIDLVSISSDHVSMSDSSEDDQKPMLPDHQLMIGGNINGIDTGKYKWAKERYVAGCANHWMPSEVPMMTDVFQWKSGAITSSEKRLVERVLGFFSTADSLAANNIVLGTMRFMTAKNARRYMIRQAYEEAIHTHTYQHIIQSLGMDEAEIFNAYNEIPTIIDKDRFLTPFIEVLSDTTFVADTRAQKKVLLKSLLMFAAVMEGMFFYAGFSNLFALKRSNKLPDTAKQIQFIARDETLHSQFGLDAAKTIILENPGLFDDEMKEEMAALFRKAVELEEAFILEMCEERTFTLNPTDQINYAKFIMNRRCTQIGMPTLYPEITACPIPWMSEMLDLKTESNFFETKISEYMSADNLVF